MFFQGLPKGFYIAAALTPRIWYRYVLLLSGVS